MRSTTVLNPIYVVYTICPLTLISTSVMVIIIIFIYKGGATLIFEMLSFNLQGNSKYVSYANTGHWSEKAITEA